MWLINVDELVLEDFSARIVYPYAILSHTWEYDETSFAQMKDQEGRKNPRHGWKIVETCRLAKARGLRYVWIDTCCIDKSSSAELSEAINSMFRWYQEAAVCFVYLFDVPSDMDIDEGLEFCRWRTRGWTLQELIAPEEVEFYDNKWQFRGRKSNLLAVLGRHTGLPEALLAGKISLDHYAVASKMAWASQRNTTRPEDTAYSLLGIFDVNMPLLYGEGIKAFRRLHEEIIKKKADLSILAWDTIEKTSFPLLNLFASSPEAFSDVSTERAEDIDEGLELSITQRGLIIVNEEQFVTLYKGHVAGDPTTPLFILEVNNSQEHDDEWVQRGYVTPLRIPLRKITAGTFARDARQIEPDLQLGRAPFVQLSKLCILTSPSDKTLESAASARQWALHVPKDIYPGFHVSKVCPASCWDFEDSVFLWPIQAMMDQLVTAVIIEEDGQFAGQGFVIVMDARQQGSEPPRCKICKYSAKDRQSEGWDLVVWLNTTRNSEHSRSWNEVEAQIPSLSKMTSDVSVCDVDDPRNEHTRYLVSAQAFSRVREIVVFGGIVNVTQLRLCKVVAGPTRNDSEPNSTNVSNADPLLES